MGRKREGVGEKVGEKMGRKGRDGNGEKGKKEKGEGKEEENGEVFASVKIKSWVRPCMSQCDVHSSFQCCWLPGRNSFYDHSLKFTFLNLS